MEQLRSRFQFSVLAVVLVNSGAFFPSFHQSWGDLSRLREMCGVYVRGKCGVCLRERGHFLRGNHSVLEVVPANSGAFFPSFHQSWGDLSRLREMCGVCPRQMGCMSAGTVAFPARQSTAKAVAVLRSAATLPISHFSHNVSYVRAVAAAALCRRPPNSVICSLTMSRTVTVSLADSRFQCNQTLRQHYSP